MTLVDVETHCEAPPDQVWALLVDWERQARWLRADAVEAPSQPSGGVGARVRRHVRVVGPLTIATDLIVTEWVPPRRLGVRRDGRLVTGVGAFEIAPTDQGTHVRWWEALAGPLGPLGGIALGVLAPRLERDRRRALARFKALSEAAGTR